MGGLQVCAQGSKQVIGGLMGRGERGQAHMPKSTAQRSAAFFRRKQPSLHPMV